MREPGRRDRRDHRRPATARADVIMNMSSCHCDGAGPSLLGTAAEAVPTHCGLSESIRWPRRGSRDGDDDEGHWHTIRVRPARAVYPGASVRLVTDWYCPISARGCRYPHTRVGRSRPMPAIFHPKIVQWTREHKSGSKHVFWRGEALSDICTDFRILKEGFCKHLTNSNGVSAMQLLVRTQHRCWWKSRK